MLRRLSAGPSMPWWRTCVKGIPARALVPAEGRQHESGGLTMSKTDHPLQDLSDRDLSTEPQSSRAWWFLGTLAVLRNPDGAPRCPTIIELTVPPGGSPPRHVHDTLDDNFLLLEGEVVVRCGERTFVARPGTYVTLPHGVDHTFRVTSAMPARMLLLHASDEFLRFIEAAGIPTH